MASRAKLVARWETPQGQVIKDEIIEMLKLSSPSRELYDKPIIAPDVARLRYLTSQLPYSEEVSPAVDLRGLHCPDSVFVSKVALAAGRLDFALFTGHWTSCSMEGATCDSLVARNILLKGDFRNASFIGADLRRTSFSGSILRGTRFLRAKLQQAKMRECDCRGADFTGAKMQQVFMPDADLRGANLSGCDLREATMGGVKFDEGTKFAGAVLLDAAMSPELRDFAAAAGAVTMPEKVGVFGVEILDEALRLMIQGNSDGRFDEAIEHVRAARPEVVVDGTCAWWIGLEELLNESELEEVGRIIDVAENTVVKRDD